MGGGVLTAWVVGHPDWFAAASSNCPVINWLSFVGTTDGIGRYRNFDKLPWEDPSEHLRRSPLMYVGNGDDGGAGVGRQLRASGPISGCGPPFRRGMAV